MVSALIVAAGKGTRMGRNIDKLFLEVAGRPVVAHTWAQFERTKEIGEVILVVREGMEPAFRDLQKRFGFNKPVKLVAGGEERQDSVWNGLSALSNESEIVAIQDAARPCARQQLISATIETARHHGAAVAAHPVTDTLKESSDGQVIERTIDRSKIWAVQTPQTFRVEIIRRAMVEVRQRGLVLTDDTAACELIGQPVHLVTGFGPNPKVTRPEDLAYIELLLKAEAPLVNV
ncbi:MAG TPA: 2-C-methyl-D-erythritol 4-phosphate cytidylyltransferase [Verrucomicrobiae bacterium]|nr:2-C-methyl-D-erythritol 4-phosphate cytidylyltransferase [Verrucomicrobiae bacterium]